MTIQFRRMRPTDDPAPVHALLAAYAAEMTGILRREYGLDLAGLGDGLLTEIEELVRPPGRLYLASMSDVPAGTAGLKPLDAAVGEDGAGVAEIKRMYVRPVARGQGVGRVLLQQLVADARADGYRTLRLETAEWMAAAHALYRSVGFVDADPYAGREFGAVRAADGIARFMELDLAGGRVRAQ